MSVHFDRPLHCDALRIKANEIKYKTPDRQKRIVHDASRTGCFNTKVDAG